MGHKTTIKATIAVAACAVVLPGCGNMPVKDGVLQQTVAFRSVQPDTVCSFYSLAKSNWKKLPEAAAHRKEVAWAVTNTKAWQSGIVFESVPQGSELQAENVHLPASLHVARSTDFLIAECSAENGQSVVMAFTHRGNPDATVASIADPTFVGVDLVAAETGFAYMYPPKVTIRFGPREF